MDGRTERGGMDGMGPRETQVYDWNRHRRRHEICDLNRTGGTARGVGRTWVAFQGSRVERRRAGGGSSRIEFLSSKSVTATQTDGETG